MASSHGVHIPLIYRLLLQWFEPLAALNGAILAAFRPSYYLEIMSPFATARDYAPVTQVVYDQLAATYVLFAFNEAVVLRLTSDLRVWKGMVLGILICDAIHVYGTCMALGPDVFIRPWLWRWEDWVNLLMLFGPGALRVALLMDIGIKKPQKSKNT